MNDDGPRPSPTAASERLARELYGVHGRQQFLSAASTLLAAVLPADVVSWNAVDLDAGTAEVFTSEGTPGFDGATVELLAEIAADHPMVRSYLGPGPSASAEPRRLSDLMARTALRRTRTYAELLHPSGAEYQLTIVTARQTAIGGRCWTLNRQHRDFDDTERDLAIGLQPLLIALDIACDVVGGTDVLSADGRVELTRREAEVLRCIARGLTAASIGRLLGISERTVRKHLQHCYRKLGCNDRLLAVDRARTIGLLPGWAGPA